MCQSVRCSKCGKPSDTGCGQHVEQVLDDVPKDKRCRCREAKAVARAARKAAGGSWWSRLLRG